jgi:redox-sensitive bicupin YhaK (pirin superfamily)
VADRGKGIVHSEMFPLLNSKGPNPAELFQIWLNLPSSDKFVEPYFSMFWDQDVPRHRIQDEQGRSTEVVVVAGNLSSTKAPAPPPNSWAARAAADVASGRSRCRLKHSGRCQPPWRARTGRSISSKEARSIWLAIQCLLIPSPAFARTRP